MSDERDLFEEYKDTEHISCSCPESRGRHAPRRPDLLIFFERKDIGALPSEGLLFYGTSFLTRGIFLRRNTMRALTA